METKLVQRFGNGGHIVLPKEYVGKRIRFLTEPKIFEDIKSEIFEILYFKCGGTTKASPLCNNCDFPSAVNCISPCITNVNNISVS